MRDLSERARDYLRRLEVHGIQPGLETISRLLQGLGNPQHIPSVIVAGTNGKGSCSAMLHSILTASGRRAGLYTSPHLVSVTERIRAGTEEIEADVLSALLERVEATSDQLVSTGVLEREPTYFEVLTACAFLHFKQTACEIAVLEVGMGGSFDATNAADPFLALLTPISRDHTEYLGQNLASIAAEKAGVMRSGRPAVSARQCEEVEVELQRRAWRSGALLEFDAGPTESHPLEDGRFAFHHPALHQWIELPLRGIHQVANASLVLSSCIHLPGVFPDALKRGIEATRWPGRLERVSSAPAVFLDGCHNPAGASTAREFVSHLTGGPKVLIFACMRDKEIAEMTRILFPAFDYVVITCAPVARAASPVEIRNCAPPNAAEIILEPELPRVLGPRWEWRLPGLPLPSTATVLIAGSLYIVGEAIRIAEPAGSAGV